MSALTDAADRLEHLPELVRGARSARGLSLRDAAEAAGVSFTIIHRVERGGNVSARTAAQLLRWIDPTAPEPEQLTV